MNEPDWKQLAEQSFDILCKHMWKPMPGDKWCIECKASLNARMGHREGCAIDDIVRVWRGFKEKS